MGCEVDDMVRVYISNADFQEAADLARCCQKRMQDIIFAHQMDQHALAAEAESRQNEANEMIEDINAMKAELEALAIIEPLAEKADDCYESVEESAEPVDEAPVVAAPVEPLKLPLRARRGDPQTFTDKVLAVIRRFSCSFTPANIAVELGVRLNVDATNKQVGSCLADLARRGKIKRVSRGVFRRK